MLTVGVLGPVAVWEDGRELELRGSRQRALLAALAIDAGRVVNTDVLAERVWGARQPERPENALQQQVLKLRRVIGEGSVAFEAPGYRLAVEEQAVDAMRFEHLVARARGRAETPTVMVDLLDQALDLWRGTALADFVYEGWAAGAAARLEELRLHAREQRADAMLRAGSIAEAVEELRRLVEAEPLRERLRFLLMLALYRDGRQGESLAAYSEARGVLVEELGIEPSSDLQELHERVLHQDPGLALSTRAGDTPAPVTARSLPGPLARQQAARELVGRRRELAQLAAAWARCESGQLASVFVAGDPGAGKTRLVAEHAQAVAAAGGKVVFACGDEEVTAPYGLFVTALGQLVENAEPEILVDHVRSHGGELSRLVPRLLARVPDLPAAQAADPETERFRLHESAVALLTAVAAREPTLLVLEDIHWADRASLLLLAQLLGGPDAPLLVLATYRGTPVDQRPPLQTLLPRLLRGPETEPLLLGSLSEADVVALVGDALGREPDEAEAAAGRLIHRDTEGNALFATELLRGLLASGRLGVARSDDGGPEVPPTIRDLVRQRLIQVGPEVERALLPATVFGSTFETAALAQLTQLDPGRLLDALERARDAALLTEDRESDRFSFSHAVIRGALADALGPTRRRLLQRRLAHELEGADVTDARRLGQIAWLWTEAGEAERGRDAALRAGDAALALLAPEEAQQWYRQALDVDETVPAPDAAARAEILVRLGEAERRSGSEQFRAHLLEAGRLGRRLGNADLLARAALANNRGMHSRTGACDHERLELLEAALELHPGADDARRALLLATTGSELMWGDHDRCRELCTDALRVARIAGDEPVLSNVIYRYAFHCAEPATLAQRLELTAELVTLTDRGPDQLLRVLASVERSRAAMENADLSEAVLHVERQRLLAADCGDAFGRHGAGWGQAWPLALAGRLEQAEQAAERALAESMSSRQPDALAFYGAQIAVIRWDQGRLAELADAILAHAEGPDGLNAHRALAALALAEGGRREEAGRLVDTAAAEGFAMPVDNVWLTSMVLWAEACAMCGRTEAAPLVLDQLLPWREHVAFTGLAVHGCAARVAAELTALLGREDTDELFALAERVHQRIEAPALLARTWVGWAEWLAACGERSRATELRARAAEAAATCGTPQLLERAAALT